MVKGNRFEIIKIVLLYAVFGCIWIYFSDSIVEWFVQDPKIITQIAIAKGSLFIFCTSLLLFVLISRFNKKILESTHAQRTSESHLRTLIHTIPDLVWLKDEHGVYLSCNLQFERLYGATQDGIMGKTDYDFVAREIADSFCENDRKAMMGGVPHINEEWLTYASEGRRALFETIKTPMYDSGGELIGILGIARDITDRKRMEEQLRASEERHRSFIQTALEGFWLADIKGRLLEVNGSYCRMSGYRENELLSMTIGDLEANETPKDVKAHIQEIIEKTAVRFETRHKRKDGSVFDVEVSVQYREEEGGRFVCFIRDISERKQSEQKLRQNEAYMSSIFRAAPTGIGVVQDRIFRRINDKFCEMLGYREDELIGRQSVVVYPSIEEFEKVGRDKYEKIHQKGTGTVETLMQRKSGETINVLLSSTPIDPNDLSAGVTFTALDITGRKLSENALRESHEQFLAVLNSIDVTIYVADIETYEILFMNKHMIDSFGRDMTGEICWKVFRGESRPCAHCTNDAIVDENNTPTDVVIWNDINPITGKNYINHDRAIRWPDGRIVRMQISTDITDLLKMEEQLRQVQRLDSIGRLAGGIAHDFNNMLSVILGNVEMIMEDFDETKHVTRKLQEIRKAAIRSADLTQQLLAFARKQPIAPQVIDLNETVEGMLKMLRRLIGEGIDFAWIPKVNLWLIKIDSSQVDQILTNLCVNAKDSINDIGKITIETDNVSFDTDYCGEHEGFVPGDYVMLSVSDNGCGMDKKILTNVFEPFYTTKDFGKGTGLGLSIVYGIVKQNNGFINIYSEVNQGTTCKIYLPRNTDELKVSESENNSQKSTREGSETILVVEDEEAILTMLQITLERLGYTLITASSPREAIRIFQEYTPDIIDLLITDIVMPEMNGIDLSEKLLEVNPNLKCLYMSGYSANVIQHHGISDKKMHFLNKPFSKEDLATKIREVLDDE